VKKPLFDTGDAESNELSRLLTQERVDSAGFKVPKISPKNDPDLATFHDLIRATKRAKTRKKGISKGQLRKLAGVKR